MSTSGAANEWDLTVPEDGVQLLAELRRHGAGPGQRVHVVVMKDELDPQMPGKGVGGRKRKSVRGVLVGKVPSDELLTRDDFEAAHQANIEAAERRFGAIDQ